MSFLYCQYPNYPRSTESDLYAAHCRVAQQLYFCRSRIFHTKQGHEECELRIGQGIIEQVKNDTSHNSNSFLQFSHASNIQDFKAFTLFSSGKGILMRNDILKHAVTFGPYTTNCVDSLGANL